MVATVLVLMLAVSCVQSLRFLSQNDDQIVLEGENAILPCEIETNGQPIMVAWSNNSNMMAFNRDILNYESDRVMVDGVGDVFNLVISNVGLQDEGEYECEVAGRGLSQTHTLTVNIPPQVAMVPDEETIEAYLGESLELTCEATGKPDPTVIWYRESGEPLPNGESTFEGQTLSLPPVDKDDSDYYICKADNGAGSPATEAFEILVRYAPTVDAETEFIHTGPGDDVSIQCTFEASPAVQVSWDHNGSDINDVVRTNIHRNSEGQMWSLKITDLQMLDMGEYTCSGGNTYGSDSATVILSGTPHMLKITSDPIGAYSNDYTLEWEVASYAAPIEYIIKSKEVNESMQGDWNSITVAAPAEGSESSIHKESHTFQGLKANGSYMVKIQATNVFGLSDWTEEFEFFTADEGHTAPPTTTPKPSTESDSDSPNYGGSENGRASPISANLVATVILVALTLFLA